MKKYVVLFTACFLVGCPGPGDKFTPRFPAVVTAKDNHVCILSSMKAGDNIRFVQIYSESGDKLIKDIDNDAFLLNRGGACRYSTMLFGQGGAIPSPTMYRHPKVRI